MSKARRLIKSNRSRLARSLAQRLGFRLSIASNSLLIHSEKQSLEPSIDTKLSESSIHVACFSPYATWDLHSTWELTVLRSLKQRGCKTSLLLCDSVSTTCDLVWADKALPFDRCLVCQNRASTAARLFRQPFEWLSRYVDSSERLNAIEWAQNLPDDGLRHARFGDLPLGDWCYGSMRTHFRGSTLDHDNPVVQQAYRDYLLGAAQAYLGCRSWLQNSRPDILWLFNGRLSLTRVALEAAKQLGIRVICHERGIVRHSIALWENERCSQYQGKRQLALTNADSPLTIDQVNAVTRWLKDRRQAKNFNRKPFLQKRRPDKAQSLQESNVSAGDQVLLALTSSDHEFGAEADRNQIFDHQYLWLLSILNWADAHPSKRVVIRFHPNASLGSWRAFADFLGQDSDPSDLVTVRKPLVNVSVVPPGNQLDTYSLIDISCLVTTYGSTAGIEAASLGKVVIAADHCLYHGMPWVQSATSPAHFLELLNSYPWTDTPRPSPMIAAGAMRFLWDYHLGPSITSHLVYHPGLDYARITYRADLPFQLDYGRDQGIDRITDIIMAKRPTYDLRPASTDATGESMVVRDYLNETQIK
jgi:hypothetical protein